MTFMNLVYFRFAVRRSAPSRFTPSRLAPSKFAPYRLAPWSFFWRRSWLAHCAPLWSGPAGGPWAARKQVRQAVHAINARAGGRRGIGGFRKGTGFQVDDYF